MQGLKQLKTSRAYLCMPLLVLTFFSCGSKAVKPTIVDPEKTATMISYNHTMVYSGNGYKRYRMFAPEIHRYELAKEPYVEYPKGIRFEAFKDSAANVVESDLVADYAIYNEVKRLWEARGNVVAHNYGTDKQMNTEQLFWNEAKELIYSNKMTRMRDGQSVQVGLGFQTDQQFETWSFNKARGQIAVEQTDSTQNNQQTTNQTTNQTPDKGADNSANADRNNKPEDHAERKPALGGVPDRVSTRENSSSNKVPSGVPAQFSKKMTAPETEK